MAVTNKEWLVMKVVRQMVIEVAPNSWRAFSSGDGKNRDVEI
jgi:hypothetical protein